MIKAGQKSYLKVENGQPVLYLTEDFKIEYVRVTETQTNPQTGQQETVVVRRRITSGLSFAGAVAGNLAGQAIGSLDLSANSIHLMLSYLALSPDSYAISYVHGKIKLSDAK